MKIIFGVLGAALSFGVAAQEPYQETQQQQIQRQYNRQECEKAKRDYEVEVSSIRSDKRKVEAYRSMMYVACGMREPDRNEVNVRVNNYR